LSISGDVNVGEAEFAFVAIAVAILSYSVSCSDPLITFDGLPEGRESLAVKFVVLL